MGLEYLASRITTSFAPAKASWWPRHCISTSLYLESYGRKRNLESLKRRAETQALEWDSLVPRGGVHGLMGKHVMFELSLVQAARAGYSDYTERIGNLLVEIAKEIAHDLAGRVDDLPEARLRYLLLEHTGLFITRVKHAVAREDGRACRRETEANALNLAAFAMEWF